MILGNTESISVSFIFAEILRFARLGCVKGGMKLETAENHDELDKKARALLEEKESDSRMMTYTGPMEKAITALLIIWTVFQLYFTTIGVISAINLRAFHCMFLLTFTFLLFPTYMKEKRTRSFPPIWDIALILLGIFGIIC